MGTTFGNEASDTRLDTAAAHATSRVPVVAPGTTARAARDAVLAGGFVLATEVVVCEDGRYLGLVRLEDLLDSSPSTVVDELMDVDVPAVAPGADQEAAAWLLVNHDERSLPVSDADGRFVGLVPPERLMRVLLEHHERDLARLGGFLGDASRARISSEEPVPRRLWHRLPWLAVGLIGALMAAELLEAFEAQLGRTVALALFIPGIVYMADAVGNQTQTLVVRGLSIGVSIRSVVWRETITGLLVGIVLAALVLPYLLWTQPDSAVAVTVTLAIFASCSIATVIAMVLPSVFHRLGRDPAFGSGPLATVVQDLLSLLVYFTIALVIVG